MVDTVWDPIWHSLIICCIRLWSELACRYPGPISSQENEFETTVATLWTMPCLSIYVFSNNVKNRRKMV